MAGLPVKLPVGKRPHCGRTAAIVHFRVVAQVVGVIAARVLFLAALAITLSAGCADFTDDDSYTFTIRSPDIHGLCYAPDSIRPNGYLVLEDLGQRRVALVETHPDRVDGWTAIASGQHKVIAGDSISFEVPKDGVILDPFYIQIVVFDCRINASEPSRSGDVLILNASFPSPPRKEIQ